MRAKQAKEWDHTSSILSMLYNINRGRSKARSPMDFHPLARSLKRKPSQKEGLRKAKELLARKSKLVERLGR